MQDAIAPTLLSIPAIILLGVLMQSDSRRSPAFATLFAAVFFATALMWAAVLGLAHPSADELRIRVAISVVLFLGVVFPTAAVGTDVHTFVRGTWRRRRTKASSIVRS